MGWCLVGLGQCRFVRLRVGAVDGAQGCCSIGASLWARWWQSGGLGWQFGGSVRREIVGGNGEELRVSAVICRKAN